MNKEIWGSIFFFKQKGERSKIRNYFFGQNKGSIRNRDWKRKKVSMGTVATLPVGSFLGKERLVRH